MKRWFIWALLLVMLFAVVGCGSNRSREADSNITGETPGRTTKGPNDGGTRSTGKNDAAAPEGDFFSFGSVAELSQYFKELGITIFDTEEVLYTFYGKETVGGVSAEHLQIHLNDIVIDIWLDDNDGLVKIIFEGEEYPVDEGQWDVMSILAYLDLFFANQGWEDDWSEAVRSTVSRDLGAGRVQVTRLDYAPSWLPMKFEIEIAEIAGRNLMIKYLQYAEEESKLGWYLHRVIPR